MSSSNYAADANANLVLQLKIKRSDSGIASGSSDGPSRSLTPVSPTESQYDEASGIQNVAVPIPSYQNATRRKTSFCKTCPFFTHSKDEYWKHIVVHFRRPPLTCPSCPFVTEYNHHLRYHIMRHSGIKPYRCEHCEYTCINNQMLTSHMKTHLNSFQFQCSICSYKTKYSHSLKQHLDKHSRGLSGELVPKVANVPANCNPHGAMGTEYPDATFDFQKVVECYYTMLAHWYWYSQLTAMDNVQTEPLDLSVPKRDE